VQRENLLRTDQRSGKSCRSLANRYAIKPWVFLSF
jgi:hypothetical protein